MPYADTDFFLALFKKSDWLKPKAIALLAEYNNSIEVSEATFIELMYVAGRYGLDPVKVTTDVMSICKLDEPAYLRAALFVKNGVGTLDAFHAAHAEREIISSDSVYDNLGMTRIRLED